MQIQLHEWKTSDTAGQTKCMRGNCTNTCHNKNATVFSSILPAERVLAADPPQLQTVGFLLVIIGTVGHNCLPAPFSAAHGLAGAEEEPVGELGGHAVQEHPQRFVAAFLAAGVALVGVLFAASGNVGGALLLAAVVEVAGLGCVQTGVAVSLCVGTVEAFWSDCEHPWQWIRRETTQSY